MGICVLCKAIIDYMQKEKVISLADFIIKQRFMEKRMKCYNGDYDWLVIKTVDRSEMVVAMLWERREEFLPDE